MAFSGFSMTQAMINPDILSWARQRAGLDVHALARKLNVDEEKLVSWEQGEVRPTFKQAQNYAHNTYVPFGYLFLKHPPKDELPIPDLRTVGDHTKREISINLRDVVRDVLQRQLWYQEYQTERGADPVIVVGSLSVQAPVLTIVADMKVNLGLKPWPERDSWEDYTRELISRIESLGILVMRSGMVGSNTHRLLSIDEFRGFAIADQFAPVIFINTADCPEARLFTLIHELTHIWLGESGISDANPHNQRQLEQLCNAVAAEFLAPQDEFNAHWQTDTNNWKVNLPLLSSHFHVSQWVIARRALELRLITDIEYWTYVNKLQADYKAREKDGSPTYNRLQTGKVSKRLAQAVVSEALSGRMLLRDAWQLIGIKPDKLAAYARKELKI
jgi:Zn-dependent peptidase ImmA (M78 family)/DNA-binding XRE family transcriptional regulator